MPLLRIFTGCRCRKTFVITTSTRLRLVSGMPCRKIDSDLRLGDVVPVRAMNGLGSVRWP
jgi:hypothetical protein